MELPEVYFSLLSKFGMRAKSKGLCSSSQGLREKLFGEHTVLLTEHVSRARVLGHGSKDRCPGLGPGPALG